MARKHVKLMLLQFAHMNERFYHIRWWIILNLSFSIVINSFCSRVAYNIIQRFWVRAVVVVVEAVFAAAVLLMLILLTSPVLVVSSLFEFGHYICGCMSCAFL